MKNITNNNNEILISVITETEIFSGEKMLDKEERIKTKIFLELFLVIPLTSEIARFAGDLSIKYILDLADSVITATSIKNDLTLITRNIKHYKNINGLKLKQPY